METVTLGISGMTCGGCVRSVGNVLKALDGVSIELPHYLNTPRPVPPPNASNNVGCNHVALQVGDLDALYRKASAQGIRFHTPPTLAGGGKAKVTYCREPEGVILELVEILA